VQHDCPRARLTACRPTRLRAHSRRCRVSWRSTQRSLPDAPGQDYTWGADFVLVGGLVTEYRRSMPLVTMPASEPRLLDGVGYPTDRVELLARAERMEAPDAIKAAIRRLSDGSFRSQADLVAAVEAIATT
jgi:hypothetical protein